MTYIILFIVLLVMISFFFVRMINLTIDVKNSLASTNAIVDTIHSELLNIKARLYNIEENANK